MSNSTYIIGLHGWYSSPMMLTLKLGYDHEKYLREPGLTVGTVA